MHPQLRLDCSLSAGQSSLQMAEWILRRMAGLHGSEVRSESDIVFTCMVQKAFGEFISSGSSNLPRKFSLWLYTLNQWRLKPGRN
jgi:hypothetical protein